jgi:hypothetical protein
MQYKTIVMELLEQHPQIHESLKRERRLLAMIESLARELKATHEQILRDLSEQQPPPLGDGSSGISSQAMEMAIAELQELLAILSGDENDDTLNLDQFMALLLQHSARE